MSCPEADASGKSDGLHDRPSIAGADTGSYATGPLLSQADEITTEMGEKEEFLRKYF